MYPTRFHHEDCSLAQYLTEIVISRQARRDGIILERGFWNDPLWKKEYREQLIAANTLLKMFKDDPSVLTVIKELNWCYSLRNKTIREEIIKKIRTRQTKESQLENSLNKEEVNIETEHYAPKIRKKKGNGFGLD